MQATYNGVDKKFQYLFQNANHVEFTQSLATGTLIGSLSIDGNSVDLYAPAGGGGGGVSDVRVDNVSIVDSNHIAQLDSSDFGTTVIANPSVSATDDLTKVQIGSTVYDIPSGGGGGQQYTCDLLFVNDPLPSPESGTANTTRTYTLSKSINDYDAVMVTSYGQHNTQTARSEGGTILILKSDYNIGTTHEYDKEINTSWGFDTKILAFSFPDDMTIKTHGGRESSGNEPILYKVYGLKFAASVINNPVYLSDYYSEEERVVGRWTDGKPLYQKTLNNLGITLQQNTWTNTGIPFTNIDHWEVIFNKSESGYDNQYPMLYRFNDGNFQAFCQYTMPLDELTLQYTKTTDLPNSGPTPGNLIYLPSIYSEQERQVGVWTDGKPIYEKTWKGLNIVLSVGQWIDTTISSNGIETIINGSGILTYPDNTYSAKLDCRIVNGQSYVKVMSQNYNVQTLVSLTIQYTKTTDQPGSGLWTPDGNPSHHYSNTEHIVGTWIDGSTIYERTWTGLSIATDTFWHDAGVNIGSANRIISGVSMDTADQVIAESYALPASGSSTLRTRSQFSGNTIKTITLQYTKSS